jgi:hypothetical protein
VPSDSRSIDDYPICVRGNPGGGESSSEGFNLSETNDVMYRRIF